MLGLAVCHTTSIWGPARMPFEGVYLLANDTIKRQIKYLYVCVSVLYMICIYMRAKLMVGWQFSSMGSRFLYFFFPSLCFAFCLMPW